LSTKLGQKYVRKYEESQVLEELSRQKSRSFLVKTLIILLFTEAKTFAISSNYLNVFLNFISPGVGDYYKIKDYF